MHAAALRVTTAPSANQREERVMANRIFRIASLPGLLLLGSAAAWAGRGDIDPNYGEGGRVSVASSALLALPGDRLVIADAATGEGIRVRMVDATGQNVAAFGDGGVVLIHPSAAFSPDAAALAPNGDMIFMGSGNDSVRALLRLDKDGQPLASFGNRGDGFVEPALTAGVVAVDGTLTPALAVDPGGKIVLAEGSWNPDSSCGSTTRLQRLLANGQPDTEFGVDGLVEIPNLDLCHGASVFGARADGSIILGDGHTVVAVDAAGDIEPTFGVGGRLAFSEPARVRGLLLRDGGLLLFRSSDEAASSNDTVFLKFDREGQPDLDFGAGTGSVTVDLGAELLGAPSSPEHVDQLALDPDGRHVVAQLSVAHGSHACNGLARLTIDGTPDAGFGRDGLTCLDVNFALVAVQTGGAPVFVAGYWSDSIYRLLSDNSPSPGFLTIVAPGFESTRVSLQEGATITVTVERVAGHDGVVSASFATVSRTIRNVCGYHVCYTGSATEGSDYTAPPGRLDWASGDDSQRTVTVKILDDRFDEKTETFGVALSELGGGVLLIAESPTIYIVDNDAAPPPPPPPPPPAQTASGGGGSVSWATLLTLLTLAFIRSRRNGCADQFRH
jgi:uncharacterized delta-60 repeat protein